MTVTATLPQMIGRTETALGALMHGVLARTGGTFPQWVALNLANAANPADAAQSTADILAGALKLDPAAAEATVAQLSEAGWLQPGTAALSEAGQARHAAVKAEVAQATAGLFDGLSAEDVATVARVLSTITERANARLSGRDDL